ncbi:hypothetical protein IW136_003536 [Coemansia sp. RSA 678]|nr:hypothetical protein IW136_003536 [Coemansia sp. RSA 678]
MVHLKQELPPEPAVPPEEDDPAESMEVVVEEPPVQDHMELELPEKVNLGVPLGTLPPRYQPVHTPIDSPLAYRGQVAVNDRIPLPTYLSPQWPIPRAGSRLSMDKELTSSEDKSEESDESDISVYVPIDNVILGSSSPDEQGRPEPVVTHRGTQASGLGHTQSGTGSVPHRAGGVLATQGEHVPPDPLNEDPEEAARLARYFAPRPPGWLSQ